MTVSLQELERVLHDRGEQFALMELSKRRRVLLAVDRGRIFGPFTSDGSGSISWISKELADPAAFDAFVAGGGWNVGGDRIWVAPEFPFFTKERKRFKETYTVQNTIDPGCYRITKSSGDRMFWKQNCPASCSNPPIGKKPFPSGGTYGHARTRCVHPPAFAN